MMTASTGCLIDHCNTFALVSNHASWAVIAFVLSIGATKIDLCFAWEVTSWIRRYGQIHTLEEIDTPLIDQMISVRTALFPFI